MDEILVHIEISKNSHVKYEYDKELNIKCYAECLDISLLCIDSYEQIKYKYQPIKFH